MDAGPLIFLAAMAVLFWFLLVRPQRQRQVAHRAMVAELHAGDEVVTAGGIIGRIRAVEDDHLLVEIAPGTEVRLAKDAIANVLRKPEDAAPVAENGG